jgi:uncharacterized protein (TIGR00251 family)
MKIINVKVKPKSNKVLVEDKGDFLVVYLKSSPEKNKANLELIKIIADYFKVDKKSVLISRGKTNLRKVLKIKE